MVLIIIMIVGGLVGGICWVLLAQQVKKTYTQWKNNQQQATEWEKRYNNAQHNYQNALQEKETTQKEITVLKSAAADMRAQADEAADAYYNSKMETTIQKLEYDTKQVEEKYQQAQEEYEKEYEKILADCAQAIAEQGVTTRELTKQIADLASIAHAAIAASKRNMEDKNTQDYYRLQIPQSDIQEIAKIREILPYLRDKDTLNKVIYKIYYEHPTDDLIKRVINNQTSGIYKITNIQNNMCYVGQTVNFANRFKQHIKRGVGADQPTHNKLYPAMQQFGVENFTFEIIEECPTNKLNEREQYWQKFFGAKEFGYSIR